LVGCNSGVVAHAFADGIASGNAVGGLVGYNGGSILDSGAKVSVAGLEVGGLVDYSDGPVSRSYAAGAVDGLSGIAGGLAAHATNVSESHATGAVSAYSHAGGLVGEGSNITLSYATGNVSGGIPVGGLVGFGSQISECFATGSVSGLGGGKFVVAHAGGLVGAADNVRNSYSTGNVETAGKGHIFEGGLVGSGDTVSSSYSIGAVTSENWRAHLGGFVGIPKAGTLQIDYWDTDTSGMSNGCGTKDCSGVTGLTTSELQSGIPAGFDGKIWGQKATINNGYPYLRANPPPH